MIHRLKHYKTRYGRAVGDEIMRKFDDYVRRTLPARDTLFRWTGPTLVAILERSCQIEGARLELKRILDKIPETDIQTATRSALLSISSRWGVFPTTPGFQLLIKKIDLFTQVHGAQ
jgi:PleD family two-component response regulator